VVHSTTKYLNGHSDVVGGAVVAREAALHEQLVWWANCLGLTGAPFDSFLTLRGLRTLHARLEHHGRNAQALAQWLGAQPHVKRVWYPGLKDHPGHEVAKRQQRAFGAVVSLELEGGHDAVRAFVGGLECFSLAESLGGVESLVAHPATMTHAAMDPAARERAGLADGLIRLSIGIEALEDLRQDLARALTRAASVLPARTLRQAVAAC
jgi:cystathionine gamma-synthase